MWKYGLIFFVPHSSNTISEKTFSNHQQPLIQRAVWVNRPVCELSYRICKSMHWCSRNSCIKLLKCFTCMHHWIWFDRHLGERVSRSTLSEILFAALGYFPASREQTLKQAVLCWKWMAKLPVDYCNKIAEGRGGADIHFTGAEWNHC